MRYIDGWDYSNILVAVTTGALVEVMKYLSGD